MKKVLSLVLAVIFVVGMTPMTFAAKLDSGMQVGISSSNSGNITPVMGGTVALGDVMVGAGKVEILLNRAETSAEWDARIKSTLGIPAATAITAADRIAVPINTVMLTKKDCEDSKITLQKQVPSGAKAIKGINLKFKGASDGYQAFVEVEYYGLDDYVATGDLDFKFNYYFLYDKVRRPQPSNTIDDRYYFEGKFKVPTQEIYADTGDFIYSYDNPLLDVKDYIKSIKIDAGNDVIINAKLFAGKKYYARVTNKVKSEDDETLTLYPDIDTVYYLNQSGLSGSGNTVKIDINDKLFVYDKDLNYLGTTADNLPVSAKYYVSSKELDVEVDEDLTAPEGPAEATNPPGGGDDVVRNVNDNPGTGR